MTKSRCLYTCVCDPDAAIILRLANPGVVSEFSTLLPLEPLREGG